MSNGYKGKTVCTCVFTIYTATCFVILLSHYTFSSLHIYLFLLALFFICVGCWCRELGFAYAWGRDRVYILGHGENLHFFANNKGRDISMTL